jgi:hypothetical protein
LFWITVPQRETCSIFPSGTRMTTAPINAGIMHTAAGAAAVGFSKFVRTDGASVTVSARSVAWQSVAEWRVFDG